MSYLNKDYYKVFVFLLQLKLLAALFYEWKNKFMLKRRRLVGLRRKTETGLK